MDERWTENDHSQVEREQATWDAFAAGDPTQALEKQSPGIIFDNGPGVGPWRHTEGQAEFFDMMGKFLPIFGDSWRQVGECIFANEQFAVALVAETGKHAESNDDFDNRAIYITRFDGDGSVDRVWTVDLDSEDMEKFWERNPVAEP